MRMPNLELTDQQVNEVVAHLAAIPSSRPVACAT